MAKTKFPLPMETNQGVGARATLQTKLQCKRMAAGYRTAKDFHAAVADFLEQRGKKAVSLRQIQYYESGAENINRAAYEVVAAFAHVLHCKMTDIANE